MKRRSMRRTARSEMLAIRTIGVDRGANSSPQEPLWTELAPSLPTSGPLEGTVQADVCVVGLGAAGLSAVIHLASRGVNVVGIDAGPLGGTATVRTAGMWFAGLPMFHHDAIEVLGRHRAIALYQETRKELAALAAQGDLAQRWSGSLRLASSNAEHDDCARQLDVMRRDGLPVEAYDGDEGHGLLFPEDGAFQPVERVRSLIEAAQATGAKLYGSTQAQQLGDRDVDSMTGEVRCRSVIVAVDGGLEHMVPALNGIVMTGRVQALASAPPAIALDDLPPPSLEPTGTTPPDIPPPDIPPPDIPPPPGQPNGAVVPPASPPPPEPPPLPSSEHHFRRPTRSRWGHDSWQQLPDGRVVIAGGRDKDRGDDADGTTTSQPVQEHLAWILHQGLGSPATITHRWAATSGFTDNRLPTLARLGPHTIAVGGYNGYGDLLGPMLGRAAADMTMGRQSALADLITGTP